MNEITENVAATEQSVVGGNLTKLYILKPKKSFKSQHETAFAFRNVMYFNENKMRALILFISAIHLCTIQPGMVIKKVNRLCFVDFKNCARWFWYLLQLFATVFYHSLWVTVKFTPVQSSHLIFTRIAVHAVCLWTTWYDTERLDLINMSTNADCQSVQCKVALAWKLQRAPQHEITSCLSCRD